MGPDCHNPIFKQGFKKTPDYNVAKALFQEFGWVKFLNKFQVFDDQVALAFAIGLRDCMANIGDIIMEVS